MNSPDLHLWYFNQTLGLGDPKWNTKIRDIREKSRFIRQIKPQKFWDIEKQTKELKRKQEEEKKRSVDRLRSQMMGGIQKF